MLDKAKARVDIEGVHLIDGLVPHGQLSEVLWTLYKIECRGTIFGFKQRNEFYKLVTEITYKKHPYMLRFQSFLDDLNINHSNKLKPILAYELYLTYRKWAIKNKHRVYSKNKFGMEMVHFGHKSKQKKWKVDDEWKNRLTYFLNKDCLV